MRDAIILLGMHRSGTSALAGVLTRLGATAPKRLMLASKDNERGYFESSAIADWHDALLMDSGSYWHDWRALDAQWLASPTESVKNGARELLEEEFGDSPLFLLKDPRICRFVPFWLSVLSNAHITPRVVVSFRFPNEVAHSLRARDGFSINKGLLLWLRHVLDAERETRGLPRSFVGMDELLTDWRSCVRRIARDVGIAWPHFDDDSSADIDEFLTYELKHHTLRGSADSSVTKWLSQGYEALLLLAQDPNSGLACAVLDRVSDSFDQACALLGPCIADLETQVTKLQTDMAALSAQRDPLVEIHDETSIPAPIPSAKNTNNAEIVLLEGLQALRVQSEEIGKTLKILQNRLSYEIERVPPP